MRLVVASLKMLMALLVADAWTYTPVAAAVQVRDVAPGDPEVTGAHIEAYANEWRMLFQAADGTARRVGTWLDSLEVVEINGVEYIRRIQKSIGLDGSLRNRQVHLAQRATMEPLRSHLSAGLRLKHVDFARRSTSGFVSTSPEAPLIAILSDSPTAAFDFEIAGILLSAFHMQPGDSLRFPSYSTEPSAMGPDGRPSAMRLNVRYLLAAAGPHEPVSSRTGDTINALPVTVKQGNRILTFWLIDVAPYVVRLSVVTSNGTTIWESP